jgi:DNA-binding response OmpR family regulator
MDTFRDRRLDFDFHLCTSRDGALRKIENSPYQLIISNARLAEKDDFSLLKQTRSLKTFVPFVVTADPSKQHENESARQILEHGAFDLIALPLKTEQTVNTIRLALWHNKFRALVTSREQAIEKYRQHIADYPSDTERDEEFQRTLSVLQETVPSVERTFQAIEKSLMRLSDFGMRVENQARKRALERLNALPQETPFR